MHLWQQPQVEHNLKAKRLSGCFVSCFLKYSCRIPQLSGCIVACNMLRPLGACCSLAIVVWPRCCRSLLGLSRGVCSLFPFHSWMGSPSNQTLAFFTTRSMLPSHCIPETAPAPPGLITPRTFEWRVMLYWSLLCKAPPPLRSKA